MIYRIVRTGDLPESVDAVMSGDAGQGGAGQKVIYVRASLTPDEQRRAIREVLRAQRRRPQALGLPLAAACRVFASGARHLPWQAAAIATAAAGTAVMTGPHLAPGPAYAAGAVPARPAAVAPATAGGDRPRPGSAARGHGHPMTGHRGSRPSPAPVPGHGASL